MEKSGFFNAMKVGDTWDRIYKAENFAEYFASFIGNGVFPNPATGLQVKETSKMQIVIKAGKAWINGFIYINTEDLILDIDVADGVLHRIDKVVLRYDVAKREIRVVVKKGEFNSKPTAPAITRNADMYELGLADITVNAGAIKISQADITDLRLNKEMCGIVHGVVDQVDTTAIFNQFESWYSTTKDNYDKDINNWTNEKKQAFNVWYSKNTKEFNQEFEEWFKTLKDKLDGDIAGNLLNSIKENTKKIEQVNSQYEDFTKQKGRKNGIAELDGEGKVKKEQLPKMNNGTILGSDGYYYRPFMQDGKIILKDKPIMYFDENGYSPRIYCKICDKNYFYGSDSKEFYKIDKATGKIVLTKKMERDMPDIEDIIQDENYLYILYRDSILKIDKNNFEIVIQKKFDSANLELICCNKCIYLKYNKKVYALNKNTLEIIAEYELGGSFNSLNTKSIEVFEDKIFLGVDIGSHIYLTLLNIKDFSKITEKYESLDIQKTIFYDDCLYCLTEEKIYIKNKNTLETIKTIEIEKCFQEGYEKNIDADGFIVNEKYIAMWGRAERNDYLVGIDKKNVNHIYIYDDTEYIRNNNLIITNSNNSNEIIYFSDVGIEKYAFVHEIKYYERISDV
ncbi:hypothetical protein G8S55_11410 [Clostridium botulinum C]|uniref:hypothetical protein n=1 Tax=Clostridium botulinum TaxID=1491 RepID=UPI001E597919|nr:hypothetical protein [Clostridium botulinum]MCD3217824.1 hypothetical protein [Clostridium botulinum C]